MKKRKLVCLIIIALLAVIAMTGCSGNKPSKDPVDTPLQLVWKNAPEKTIAILINQPTAEQLKNFAPSERLVLEHSNESFLLIPADEVEEITIWKLEFNGLDFVRTEAVYSSFNPSEEYVLNLEVMRPEGGPHFGLSLLSDEHETRYYIAYDGKDGTPNIEYIEIE